jgi:hypothetical protein
MHSRDSQTAFPLPELVGRVAVIGGMASDKTSLMIGLALNQVNQRGTVLCLDARSHRQTEMQFRLLLRKSAVYVPLPATGEIPAEVSQPVMKTLSDGLATDECAPLLLLDGVRSTPPWEHFLSFALNAGAVVVELLASPAGLVFGRYDTVLLLRERVDQADVVSRAVGRKVSAEDLTSIKSGEGVLIHRARTLHVVLPVYGER